MEDCKVEFHRDGEVVRVLHAEHVSHYESGLLVIEGEGFYAMASPENYDLITWKERDADEKGSHVPEVVVQVELTEKEARYIAEILNVGPRLYDEAVVDAHSYDYQDPDDLPSPIERYKLWEKFDDALDNL